MGKFIEGNEERRLSLELYRKDELFCVYISDDEGGSGITVEEPSPEEAAKEAAKYIADYFVKKEEDEEIDEKVEYFDADGTQILVGDTVVFKNKQESCTYEVACFEDDFVVIDDGESKHDVFPYELVVIQSALQEEERERFTLLYDGEEGDFSTKYLKNAIVVALADYAEGGYEKIEVYDNEKDEVVWTTNSDFEDIKEHLDEWADGRDIEEVEVYLKTKGAVCYDEDIDDGIGNGEYLMYRAYNLDEHTIKVYYSSTTHEVTCIQYRDE